MDEQRGRLDLVSVCETFVVKTSNDMVFSADAEVLQPRQSPDPKTDLSPESMTEKMFLNSRLNVLLRNP